MESTFEKLKKEREMQPDYHIQSKSRTSPQVWLGRKDSKVSKNGSKGDVKLRWSLRVPISEATNIITATTTTLYQPKNNFVLQKIVCNIKGDGTNKDNKFEIRVDSKLGKLLGKISQGGADDSTNFTFDYVVKDEENDVLGIVLRDKIIIVSTGTGTLDGTFTIIGYEVK